MEYQTEKIPVNDGHGLYDNEGLIDTLLVDCNDLPKALIDSQFVKFGLILAQMVRKLSNLKDGIRKDMESKDRIIRELREINDGLAEQLYGVPSGEAEAEKDNA